MTLREKLTWSTIWLAFAVVGWLVGDVVSAMLKESAKCESTPQCVWERDYKCVDGIVYFRNGMEVKFDPMTMQPQTCGPEEQ